jgi:hypothetical protein
MLTIRHGYADLQTNDTATQFNIPSARQITIVGTGVLDFATWDYQAGGAQAPLVLPANTPLTLGPLPAGERFDDITLYVGAEESECDVSVVWY